MDFAIHLAHAWDTFVANPLVKLLFSLLAAAGLVAGCIKLVNAIREWRRNSRAGRLAERLNNASHLAAFTQDDLARACRNYIEPSCTQVDPADEDDIRAVVALAPLFKTIDDHFEVAGEKRHIILLADSGMGKTCFCLNYYAREQRKRASKRKPIAIVPLGRPDAVGAIAKIDDKRNTVLFLDAFDEAPEAIGNETEHLSNVMSASSDFRNIVVTCRSQFFSSDEAIPKGSGIFYAGARKAGTRREFPLHKLFLSPLSRKQIDRYIVKHFPYGNIASYKMRTACRKLVDSIPELSVRPMLLELLPDLVRAGRFISQLYDLYEFLVQQWLQREKDWIDEVDLLDISTELAVVMYCNQRERRGDRMAPGALDSIASTYRRPLATWKLKSRSLLNRDIEGNFKFAHRSVMEYLFVRAALNGDKRCVDVDWTDMMKDLLVSLGTHQYLMDERVLNLFARDLSKTGIFPLATPIKEPRIRSAAESKEVLKNPSISKRQSRGIPTAWRIVKYVVKELTNTGKLRSFRIHDTLHDIRWRVVEFGSESTGEDRDLYRDQALLMPDRKPESRWKERASVGLRDPSIEEIFSLWESEPYLCETHGLLRIFHESELYWLGDTIDGSLLCSFGSEPQPGDHLRVISARVEGRRKFHLYELSSPYSMVGRKPFVAMHVHIEDSAMLAQPIFPTRC